MNSTDWQKIKELFSAALDLPADERLLFLEKTDENLRCEVEKLLESHAEAGDFIVQPALVETGLVEEDYYIGTQIGPYEIIREIARGGMGTVYLAVRADDFEKRVAVKLIKRGMDSTAIHKSFVRERQILAGLEHPFIARILDGGTTDEGLPYFVMEYVKGLPITEFCDSHELDTTERLKLFRKVCEAVEYAHQHLIVHRDLKPSNILITEDGEPKLLDFGIAKLLDSENEGTMTETDFRLLTPEYASPEQIRGEKINTSSDIYSAGVLLFELLTGERPYQIKSRNPAEIICAICEVEPSKPSEVSTQETTKGKKITKNQKIRTEEQKIRTQQLKGDLDNIILKSLRKEPNQRYSSIEKFSEDIERHLSGLPVIARPATFGYQVSKFVRRNQTAVIFASIALLTLVTGLTVAVWQAVEARKQRISAEKRASETRRLANTLLIDLDKELNELPYLASRKLIQVSSDYLNGLAEDSAQDPKLLQEIAEAYARLADKETWYLADKKSGKANYQRAIALSRQAIFMAPDDMNAKKLLAACLEQYADRFGADDRHEYLSIFDEIIFLREEILTAQPNDYNTLKSMAKDHFNYGVALKLLDRDAEALTYFRRYRQLFEQIVALLETGEQTPEHRLRLAYSYLHIGMGLGEHLGDWQASESNLLQAAQISDALIMENPDYIPAYDASFSAHEDLANLFSRGNDLQSELVNWQAALTVLRAQNARQPSSKSRMMELNTMVNLSNSLLKTGQTALALEMVRESIQKSQKWFETAKDLRGHYAYGKIILGAGDVLAKAGHFDEALSAYLEAEKATHKILKDLPGEILGIFNLAVIYMRLGDLYADCPVDGANFRTTDRVRLEKALSWYQKGANIYSAQQSHFVTLRDKENANLAQSKLFACAKKLNKSIRTIANTGEQESF